ncbi:MAG TPA: S-layer homology domain-containing protein [Acetivibrio sp.]|nr:S-layer homology domain-containing protein [Acetivibrio sp.]
MKKAPCKKISLIAVSLCIILTIVCQNAVFVSAEPPVGQKVKVTPEQVDKQDAEITVEIPGIFDVSGITVDTGQVTNYSINGDKVTISVTGGQPKRVGPDTRHISVTESYDHDNFPGIFEYSRDGYTGSLPKVNSGYNEEKKKYWAQYEGEITKQDCNFYSYEITIDYVLNVAPVIHMGLYGYTVNSKLDVIGYVIDENIGDSLQIYYSIDDNNEIGATFLDPIISTGNRQEVSDVIDISPFNLSEGNHNIFFWVIDKKGLKSNSYIVSFTVDRTPPEAPILTPDKTEPTNTSVIVSVYYPPDAYTKEVKIGDNDWAPIGSVTDGYEILIEDNTIIEARCTDEAGNVSPVSTLVIDNIDKTPPEAPTIKTSATETTGSSITATIEPGNDEGSGIKTTEYCLKGATNTEWSTYNNDYVITITSKGETEIWARSIDNAGNVSDIAKKTVKIKSESSNPGDSGNNNPGNQNNDNKKDDGNNNNRNDKDQNKDKEITEPDDKKPGAAPVDLSIFISADKSKYAEDDIITLELNYKNKSGNPASNVVVKAEIPPYTTPVETANGKVNDNYIEWKIDSLNANSTGKIQYTLKVGQLDKAEVNSSVVASITSDGTPLNPDDDESKTIFLLYSDRFKDNFHKKYIAGYEDNTFRPLNNITRAEVATIMANVLDIKGDITSSRTYTDLSDNHWAYKNIMAVTEKGLFTGYLDGSFHPDSYITRAEFATVLAKYLQLKDVEHDKLNFSDINGHWARNYIEEIFRIKLIEGYIENGQRLFKPDSYITRSEAVTIINKMLFRGPLFGAKVPFNDVAEDYWAFGHIAECSIDHYFTRNEDESETIVVKENE